MCVYINLWLWKTLVLLHFPGRHLACASSDSDAVVEASELQLGLLERLPSSSLGILSKGKHRTEAVGSQGPTRGEDRESI